MELNPGFTGATLDRADALRANDEKLAAARADPRARLLGLNGLEPLTGGDGSLFCYPLALDRWAVGGALGNGGRDAARGLALLDGRDAGAGAP